MKDKTPAYKVEIRSPNYFPTYLIYDYKRHGKPTAEIAAEMLDVYASQMGQIDTLKIIRNTGSEKGEVVASATGIIHITYGNN